MDAVYDSVVIGGGAAGFFAAITAAESHPAGRALILERNRRVLAKVRISGGGRCNVTHACFDPAELVAHYPRGGNALRGPFARFQPRDTIAWFEARGVRLKAEADGRVFPVSDDSATIVDCLVESARRAGVDIRTDVAITALRRASAGFAITLADGTAIEAGRVLLATGSGPKGWQWARELGHTVVPPVPSLFTFESGRPGGGVDPRLDGLAGIAVKAARVRLLSLGHEQAGPLLITHWGLSGPAVLKLSAWAARGLHACGYRAELEVSWLPHLHDDALRAMLTDYKRSRGPQLVAAHSPFGALPHRLWRALAAAAEVHDDQRWAKLPKANVEKLVRELLHGSFAVTGKGEFKDEFVTCGGVALDEVDFRTMESKRAPGLFLAGEVLDIDGVTGGFNFQSAWTTGWLAGRAMAG